MAADQRERPDRATTAGAHAMNISDDVFERAKRLQAELWRTKGVRIGLAKCVDRVQHEQNDQQ